MGRLKFKLVGIESVNSTALSRSRRIIITRGKKIPKVTCASIK